MGNLTIISDSRIRSITATGPQYRFPEQIDFQNCRKKIAASPNEYCTRGEHVDCDALKDWRLNIFKIIDRRISFYSQNTNMLRRKPAISCRFLKLGFQELYRKHVFIPADCCCCLTTALRLMNRLPLKRSLSIITIFFQNATTFGVSVYKDEERLPTV